VKIEIRRGEYRDVECLRELYRAENPCQIWADSALRRRLAEPYLLLLEGRLSGYGAVWTQIDPGRLTELYLLPFARQHALEIFRELLRASAATEIAAQTNIPLLTMLLYDCATHIGTEKILFEDAFTSNLAAHGATFRPSTQSDASETAEAPTQWIVEFGGNVVTKGGFLCHYNPPYGDIFMEVREGTRQRGFGSYLVQELKRVCYEAGRIPVARCSPGNVASRKTLQKAGLLPCARVLVGRVEGDHGGCSDATLGGLCRD